MPKPYKIEFTHDEAQAIFFHGGRYNVSDFLERHMTENEEGNCQSAWTVELEENQAWVLKDLWEDEGPLACGSESFNSKLQQFIDSIV